MKLISLLLVLLSLNAQAGTDAIEELNPNDPNIDQILQNLDQEYQDETGLLPFLDWQTPPAETCFRFSCRVYAQVVKSEQKLYLYLDGVHVQTWLVSSGVGNSTPNFDKHPNGRIYDAYTSTKHPGGNYNGLGNMPYAVFIHGGFAIHGTTKGNWKYLGKKASHGCIRLHPDNGLTFNRLVREHGIYNVWITVQD